VYALDSLGWLALQTKKYAGAVEQFEDLIKLGPAIDADLVAYAGHGRALALYALAKYPEARSTWHGLSSRSLPPAFARDVGFWLGETLGRMGEFRMAAEQMRRFTGGGPHALLETGTLRLGWWSLSAGQYQEAAKAFGSYLAAYPRGEERPWASIGLVQARAALGDLAGALEEARRLQAADPLHPLVVPALLLLLRESFEKGQLPLVRSIQQDLLAMNLSRGVRSYVLFLAAEASRREGQGPEARSQYELARSTEPGSPVAWRATLRISQADLETREFRRALAEVDGLLNQPLTPEFRAVALLLRGEAGYWARLYAPAGDAFNRFLQEFPGKPEAPPAAFSLAWTESRQGRRDQARERWLDFARDYPQDPLVADALLLAADIAGQTGDGAAARDLLDRFTQRFPSHPDAPVAKLNLAILDLQARRYPRALFRLGELTQSAQLSPFIGRMKLAMGLGLLASGNPREAARPLTEALAQGEEGLAHLGLGYAALAQNDWREAERHLLEARNLTGEPARTLAEYGAATATFKGGKRVEFTRLASPLLQSPEVAFARSHLLRGLAVAAVEDGRWTEAAQWALRLKTEFPQDDAPPRLIHALAAVAMEQKRWSDAGQWVLRLMTEFPQEEGASRLVHALAAAAVEEKRWADARRWTVKFTEDFPKDQAAPDALARLGAAAFAANELALARESYDLLLKRYPQSPRADEVRVDLAEAMLKTGAGAEARQLLEQFVTGRTGDSRLPRAWFLLAQARQAVGDRARAVDAYTRLIAEYPQSEFARGVQTTRGRLLQEVGRWEESRQVWEKIQNEGDAEARVEAAYRLGEAYRVRERYEDAAEAYMTAAYLGRETLWGRRALIGAGQSFVALKDGKSAAIVYRKLLDLPNVEPELAQEATAALQRLGQRQ
jgi:TolA-binding protein